MIRHTAQHSTALTSCGCLGAIILFFPWFLLNFTESPAFYPLAWSPDEKHLAFGVHEEYSAVGLYIVDANGEHFRKLLTPLCGAVENCNGDLIYIKWSDDGQEIYFALLASDIHHYAISANGSNLRLIEMGENTYTTDTSDPADGPNSRCDDVDYVTTREISPGGLLAQSSCSGEDCRACQIAHCTQDLLVCDTKTEKLLFKIDHWDYSLARSDYSFWARFTPMLLSLLLAVIGLIAVLVGLVVGSSRKPPVDSSPNTPEV